LKGQRERAGWGGGKSEEKERERESEKARVVCRTGFRDTSSGGISTSAAMYARSCCSTSA
jgi:hypothetical protein